MYQRHVTDKQDKNMLHDIVIKYHLVVLYKTIENVLGCCGDA